MPCIHDNKSEDKWTHVTSQDWLYKRDIDENSRLYYEAKEYCKSAKNKHLGHATDKIYVIDIDCKDISKEVKGWLKRYPYYASSTKPYGYHILINNTGPFVPSKRKYNFVTSYGSAVELLCGLWSFAPRNGLVYNWKKSMDLELHEDMFVHVKPTKLKRETRASKVNYDSVQDKIVHYLKRHPLLNERCIELLQFEAYDEEKQVWQIRIRSSIEGFCPCKHDVSSNDHRASICISPKMVWMRCFRNDGSSDCNARALRWWLPIEEAKDFFPGYHDDFSLLYGVKANEPFRCSTTWICNRFLYSNRDRYIYCNKRLYEKDEFGMYRLCQHALPSVVFSHLKQLRESCEMNKIRYSKAEKGSEEYGLLKESNKLLGKIDNEAVAIVNHIRANLTDHLFLDKVDSDTSLLPFDNGVLDLNHVDRGVRKATVNEYVMKKCRYSFVKASAEEISELKSKLLPHYVSQEEMDFR